MLAEKGYGSVVGFLCLVLVLASWLVIKDYIIDKVMYTLI
jgi:hypothetical protein